VPLLEELFRTRSSAAWQKLLEAADVPHAPVWNYAQLFADPQAAARGLKLAVRDPQGTALDLIGSPFHIAGATLPEATMPPHQGQHTDEILRELLGLDTAQIGQLRQQGIVG
jgi:crotonobetainyl-CoA:carnitine CoA-transferase CaiB-like acyl-CoA transferase